MKSVEAGMLKKKVVKEDICFRGSSVRVNPLLNLQ